MAEIVAIRRTRAEYIRLTAMVANGVHKVMEQDVLLVELGLRHVDVHEDLAKQKLKLKFRMNGITYWKSIASRAAMAGDKHMRINLNTAKHAVFEGGESLDFELCKQRYLRSSSMVASCKIPLTEVMHHSADVDDTPASVWNIDLLAADAPEKVLGSLAIDARVRTVKLQAAGGIEALKAHELPRPPVSIGTASLLELDENTAACQAFAEKAAKAQLRLQEVFDTTMALAGSASVQSPEKPAAHSSKCRLL